MEPERAVRLAPECGLAWELLSLAATIDPGWTRFSRRLTLAPPPMLRLLDEWPALLVAERRR